MKKEFGKEKVNKQVLKDSLKKSKKKIAGYLDYYTYVMSQKDLIQDRHTLIKRDQKNKKNNNESEIVEKSC